MNPLSASERESSRIEAAYERRKRSTSLRPYSGFDRANLFRIQEVESGILALLKRFEFAPLHDKRILEIGCGSGFWLRKLVEWGASPENLSGMDLLAERLVKARRLCANGIDFQCGDASQLPYPDGSFDLVLQCTVFTSILDPKMKERVALEMLRVLRPKGFVLWYDFFVNNPGNPDARGIGKQEVNTLFPGCYITFQRVSLAPPLGRWLGPCPSFLYSILSAVKLFDTHYLALIVKEG